MDNDWIEEEFFVYVDYDKFIPASEITDPDMQFKIIGIDQETVYSEVNGKIYSGTHGPALGTYMFFVEDPEHPKSDNIFDRNPDKSFSLHGVCDKVVTMKRIFVEPKGTEGTAEAGPSTALPKHCIQVKETYQEALDSLLKPGQLPPRTVTDALDNKIMLEREIEMECSDN